MYQGGEEFNSSLPTFSPFFKKKNRDIIKLTHLCHEGATPHCLEVTEVL